MAEGCAKLTWDWNTRALALYKKLGGKINPDYVDVRLYRPNLRRGKDGGGRDGEIERERVASCGL